jgi:hypothetical protein
MRESARHRRNRLVPRKHPAGGRAKPPAPPSGRRRQRPPGGYVTSPEEAAEALEKIIADLEETIERDAERMRWLAAAEEARRERNLSHYKHRRL